MNSNDRRVVVNLLKKEYIIYGINKFIYNKKHNNNEQTKQIICIGKFFDIYIYIF